MYYMISIYKGGWLYVMYVGVLYYVPVVAQLALLRFSFYFCVGVGEYWVIGGLV